MLQDKKDIFFRLQLLCLNRVGAVHKQRWQLGGVKNWSKLSTDSIVILKNADMPGEGGVKIRKKCRRRLWMVPM